MVEVQNDQKVSVHLMITVQSSGAQRLFDHCISPCRLITEIWQEALQLDAPCDVVHTYIHTYLFVPPIPCSKIACGILNMSGST
jgi:hypothetical protein